MFTLCSGLLRLFLRSTDLLPYGVIRAVKPTLILKWLHVTCVEPPFALYAMNFMMA